MPWDNSPAKRARDAKVYGPEYRRNRKLAWNRAGGRCEELLENGQRCRSQDRCQVDHLTPVTQGGTHHLDNLGVKCFAHHAKKTAQEGGGYRKPGQGGKQGWRNRQRDDPPLAARTKW